MITKKESIYEYHNLSITFSVLGDSTSVSYHCHTRPNFQPRSCTCAWSHSLAFLSVTLSPSSAFLSVTLSPSHTSTRLEHSLTAAHAAQDQGNLTSSLTPFMAEGCRHRYNTKRSQLACSLTTWRKKILLAKTHLFPAQPNFSNTL